MDITNDTRREVNLDGWTLSDRAGHTYTFHHYRLEGRATVRVHTGIGRNSRTDLYQDRLNYVWNNRSDTATLRDDHGSFVDAVSWGPVTAAATTTDHSTIVSVCPVSQHRHPAEHRGAPTLMAGASQSFGDCRRGEGFRSYPLMMWKLGHLSF